MHAPPGHPPAAFAFLAAVTFLTANGLLCYRPSLIERYRMEHALDAWACAIQQGEAECFPACLDVHGTSCRV